MDRVLACACLVGLTPALAWAAPPPAPTASSPAPAALAVRCAALAKENQQQVDRLRGQELGEEEQALLGRFGKCLPAGRGAWALRLDKVAPHEATGRWSVVYLGTDGSTATVSPAMPMPDQTEDLAGDKDNLDWSVGNEVRLPEPVLFDYDGDGVAELILRLGSRLHEDGEWEHGRVWTARGGAVRIYGPAKDLIVRGVRDVDGDGRPDLLIRGAYATATEWPYSGFGMELAGPELLAHSLKDGRFSQGDEVAAGVARASCPKRPAKLVLRDQESKEIASKRTGVNVACARLWGGPAAQVQGEIRRTCQYKENAEPASYNCHFRDIYLKWAEVTPPLVLR